MSQERLQRRVYDIFVVHGSADPVAECRALMASGELTFYVGNKIRLYVRYNWHDSLNTSIGAIPATGVLIGKIVNVRNVGGADFDTLTGAGRYRGAEIYLILHNELINGRGNVSRRHLLDSVYSAKIAFVTYVPTTAGGWTLRPNVDSATFGLCEVMHGPWSVAAADFWSCDHVHYALRCLMRNPDLVRSASTLYEALRDSTQKDCEILPRNRRDTLESRANSPKQKTPFRFAAFTPDDAHRSPFDATSLVRRAKFFQSSFDDPGWTTCPLGCCAVYR